MLRTLTPRRILAAIALALTAMVIARTPASARGHRPARRQRHAHHERQRDRRGHRLSAVEGLTMRTTRLIATVTLGLVAVIGLGVTPASAHSKLASSSPEDGATLDVAPASVSFTFDEPLLPGTDTISVSDQDGNVIASEQVTPDGATIKLAWPAEASSGAFQAAYRVVSGDGHPAIGSITITIASHTVQASVSSPAATSSTAPSTTAPDEPARGVAGSLVVIVALAVMVLGAVAGITLWRRHPD